MDLFHKFGLSVVSWSESVKIQREEGGKTVVSGLINDVEAVNILEINRSLDVLTSENILGIFYLKNIQVPHFLKFRHLIVKEDNTLYFAYEKANYSLSDYLSSHELSVEKRLFIYKSIVEVVYNLISFKDQFSYFDPSLFFISEGEFSVTGKLLILKFIYHAGLTKNDNEGRNLPSKNFYFWLFYLHFIVFKDYTRDSSTWGSLFETLIPLGNFHGEIESISDYLSDVISGRNFNLIPITSFIERYNLILKKANIEEIIIHLNGNGCNNNNHHDIPQLFSNKNHHSNNGNNFNMSGGIYPPNMNFMNYPMNSNHSTNFFSKQPNNFNYNNSYNNSQVNYNQYIQFFNSNNTHNSQNIINQQNKQNQQNQQNQQIYPESNNSFKTNHVKNNSTQNLNFLNSPKLRQNFDVNSNINNVDSNNLLDAMVQNHFMNYGNIKLISPYLNIFEKASIIPNLNPLQQFSLADTMKLNSFKQNSANPGVTISNNKNEKLNNYQTLSVDNIFNDKIDNYKIKACNSNYNAKNIQKQILFKNSRVASNKVTQNINQNLDQNVIQDPITGSFLITFNRKILLEYKSISASASVCSEEEREFLKKKRINEQSNNSVSVKGSSAKKKLRAPTAINYNFDTPYKSSTISYNDFNENDLEMINKINNPRRKKLKMTSQQIDEGNFFSSEKASMIKSELLDFSTIYETELENKLESKFHIFMKNHFPIMYNLDNFYLYLFKLNKERSDKKYVISIAHKNIKEVMREKEIIEDTGGNVLRKVWDSNKKESEEIDNYVYTIEKLWPFDKYNFSQEAALEFLSLNCYNTEISVKQIEERSKEFESFIKDKKLNKDEYPNSMDKIYMISGKVSKRIHLK